MNMVRQSLEGISPQYWTWERALTAVISISLLVFCLSISYGSLRKPEVVIDQTTGKELKRPSTLPSSATASESARWTPADARRSVKHPQSQQSITDTGPNRAYMDRLVPIRVAFPGFTNYIISGPESMFSYFRKSRDLSTTSRSLVDLDSYIGSDWIEHHDLNGGVEKRVFEATVRALFGDHILTANPTLADDFWHYDLYIGPLFMGAPRWWNPAAYRAQWEPFYGSRFIRDRQNLLTKRGILDETARAAENFAFMWATNSNSVIVSVWCVLEILQDVTLKEKVTSLLPSLTTPPTPEITTPNTQIPTFTLPVLTSNPLLQPLPPIHLRPNFSFRGYHIKQDKVLSISTLTESLDPEIWSTGPTEPPHPLNTFWVERFLVNPADAESGPARSRKDRKRTAGSEPYFSLDGLAGSWIPYGGGKSFCPGRHFAKREILMTAAAVLGTFEIELLDTGKEDRRPEGNMRYFWVWDHAVG
ncbi:hypothetical protein BO70DRAFT_377889 [Aspergillus heteromorphus CBS 117.55]|uniref:Cytochrome P450 n=1 Tax=Aspergillus heteromorphus CBS 117.55 TaxID=1448321 RepID=A0A317WRN4_9EURO|nr:uncharacterized protein BO70DRAFT_377889 [Aspergillus heteromorphus CBS 117.55]PWY88391.1 hypothetical protein BO70DRAFT_377889 [Aspergillus heteromorphus CBS 117.55]